MATIRIAKELLPTRSNTGISGGFYPIRENSIERSRPRSRSRDACSRLSDLRDPEIEQAGLARDGDFKKKKQVTCSGKLRDCVLTSRKGFKGRLLPYLAYQSVGVIYGEIGTNPLYVYSSTFMSEPSHEDLVGVLSGKEVSMLLSKFGKIVYTK